MDMIEMIARHKEYRNVFEILVDYCLSKGEEYRYIFCQHGERLTCSPRLEELVKKRTVYIKESGLYVKYVKAGENLSRWRVKVADMTACSSCVCRIVVEVYRDCDEMERARWRKAGNRHGEISLGLDWQRHLDTAGDVITGPLYQELVSKIGESGLKARSAEKRVVEEGDRWLVFDTTEDGKEGSKYLVKKYKDRLGVYQKKTFTVVPHCKYLRVSAVGGEWFGLVDPYLFVLNCEEPLRNVPAFEKYGVGEWTVIECCTREFETVLNQLSP